MNYYFKFKIDSHHISHVIELDTQFNKVNYYNRSVCLG